MDKGKGGKEGCPGPKRGSKRENWIKMLLTAYSIRSNCMFCIYQTSEKCSVKLAHFQNHQSMEEEMAWMVEAGDMRLSVQLRQ